MRQTWRWFGPGDPVTLDHARQAGAAGIVTALHHMYDGRTWTLEAILAQKNAIDRSGLDWAVCESIPMNDSIKLRSGDFRRYVDSWKDSLANLGRAGVPVVCYNFMPVLDWTRTDVAYRLASGGYAGRFDRIDFAAYDIFMLKRARAEGDYPGEIVKLADQRFRSLSPERRSVLEATILGGLPAREERYTRQTIAERIAAFSGMDASTLRANLLEFLREILPVAKDVGVRMGIHPDDPPISLFGLPRIVSTAADARVILASFDQPENGLTFCAGSFGSRADNDCVAMVSEFAPRIHFVHLRNVALEPNGSFYEASHLDGDTDMVGVVEALMNEERRRRAAGDVSEIPMRPDHGHLLVDDIGKTVNAGYSCIGRLKGLGELRGVMRALDRVKGVRHARREERLLEARP